jgi:branched-chain amino acid transport system ATP-binding protein
MSQQIKDNVGRVQGESLKVADLGAGYGRLQILQDVNVDLPAGEFTAFLGPNGSGKSTLLKSIMGLTDLFGGSIALDGRPIAGTATERMAAMGVAYVPQRGNVFTSMGVGENLKLAVRTLQKDERESALADTLATFPALKQRLGLRAGQLSGGERQMLAIAIGWLLRPRLMLLDEPSAGLAPLVVTEIFRTLRALADRGLTLGVVEQNARSILRWCDGVYVLREGRIAFHGTAEQVQADEEIVKSYLGVAVP